MNAINPQFIDKIRNSESFNATACMNCGVCTAVCPMGFELLPRQLFRYVIIGCEDKVRDNQLTIFSCLLCKMCEQNCPAGVNIAENIRTLRVYFSKEIFGFSRS